MRIPRLTKGYLRRKCSPLCMFAVSSVVICLLVIYNWPAKQPIRVAATFHQCRVSEKTQKNTDLGALMALLADPNERNAHAWIRLRIQKLWPYWVKAINSEVIRNTFEWKSRRRKKILLYLGFLSKDSGLAFVANQFKGGFLGELVQWSDLISSLYILGHDIIVISEVEQLNEHRSFFEPVQTICGDLHDNPSIIFTDIIGNGQINRHILIPEYHYKCRIRILDCFGTEPKYNDKHYISSHNTTSYWGGLDLNTQQFFTMFPHSPDNSFVGFVVPNDYTNGQNMRPYKEDIALVYGKTPNLWQGKQDFLKVFMQNSLTVHGTLKKNEQSKKTSKDPDVLPDFVVNHGYMNGSDLRDLVKKTKIFVGLGEPTEGPSPLEAIASGAVFINPKFDPPKRYRDRGKPNERELFSQNPYVATYTGGNYMYTVDIKNIPEVDRVVKKILKDDQFESYLPFEFTFEGHIQRMSSYIEHQDFCNGDSQTWPPREVIQTVRGNQGSSCKDTCAEKDLVCEPSHFVTINAESSLKHHHHNCTHFRKQSDMYFPAIDTTSNTCIIQNNRKWFSCVGGDRKFARLCPCRDHITQQTALCKGCE